MVSMYGKKSDQFYQPIIPDNLMFSNKKSRLRGLGDYIRGDLRITPDNYKTPANKCGDSCEGYGGSCKKWFQVSVIPNNDLNPGFFAQEALRGKEAREQLVAIGLEPPEELTNLLATKGRDEKLSITFGTDISADSYGL
jgi:hypothetical protein